MKAFYGIPELKEHYLGRLKWHMDMDHLARGYTWEKNGHTRGCAVGCSMEKYDHSAYEREWQVPEWLAKIEDTIFENMSQERHLSWPYEFADAINPGSDLEQIKIPFLIIICESVLESVQDPAFSQQQTAIQNVIKVLKIDPTNNDAKAAAGAAAWTAARAAAGAAAWAAGAADWTAAWAAAWAAEAAAWTAARAAAGAAAGAADWATVWAARAAARAAAGAAKYDYFADRLLELIRNCK